MIEQTGPSGVSLRELARRLGVSHAAPRHHFADKAALLTAVAIDGYRLLGDALEEAWTRTGEYLEVGVAYVRFAVGHRAHFEVMFRPELYRADDPDLRAARTIAGELLYGPAAERDAESPLAAAIAAWSLMHGVALLWLNGSLPRDAGDNPELIARAAGRFLFAK